MKITKIDKSNMDNYFRCELTPHETRRIIFEKVSRSNPTLRENDIAKAKNSKGFEAHFSDEDGNTKSLFADINILKGYFGVLNIGIMDDGGVWFYKKLRKSVRCRLMTHSEMYDNHIQTNRNAIK